MGKPYAQIDCSLLRSKKLRALGDNSFARYAYFSLHLVSASGYLGIFHLSDAVWADEADASVDQIKEARAALVEVGLIEFDEEESFFRIVGWWLKKNCPDNASTAKRRSKDLQRLSAPPSLLLNSVAEFLVGCLMRARNWGR